VAAQKRIVVAGSRGVFGTLLVRELAPRYDVIATTRETLDLADVDAVASIARDAFAFACAAGPFARLDRRIVRAVVDAGAHWLDISDDATWFFDLVDDLSLDALARERGVVVMPGLSTLPALSYALVRELGMPREVDITMYIGNGNAKGAAAIASGAALDAPDRELLRREGIDARVRTRFQLPGVSLAMRALSRLPLDARLRLARVLSRMAKPFCIGESGGYVEVRAGDRVARATGADQRIAIAPLVFALDHIDALQPGVRLPRDLDHNALLTFLPVAP
jgi:hypothetical protein